MTIKCKLKCSYNDKIIDYFIDIGHFADKYFARQSWRLRSENWKT